MAGGGRYPAANILGRSAFVCLCEIVPANCLRSGPVLSGFESSATYGRVTSLPCSGCASTAVSTLHALQLLKNFKKEF